MSELGINNKLVNYFKVKSLIELTKTKLISIFKEQFQTAFGQEWKSGLVGQIEKTPFWVEEATEKQKLQTNKPIEEWDMSILLGLLEYKLQSTVEDSILTEHTFILRLKEANDLAEMKRTKTYHESNITKSRRIKTNDYEEVVKELKELLKNDENLKINEKDIEYVFTDVLVENEGEPTEKAIQLKAKGNSEFTSGDYMKAVQTYTSAINVQGISKQILCILYLNRSISYFNLYKTKNIFNTIAFSDNNDKIREYYYLAKIDALLSCRLRPSWEKPYYRLGQYFNFKGKFRKSKRFFVASLAIKDTNECQEELKDTRSLCKAAIFQGINRFELSADNSAMDLEPCIYNALKEALSKFKLAEKNDTLMNEIEQFSTFTDFEDEHLEIMKKLEKETGIPLDIVKQKIIMIHANSNLEEDMMSMFNRLPMFFGKMSGMNKSHLPNQVTTNVPRGIGALEYLLEKYDDISADTYFRIGCFYFRGKGNLHIDHKKARSYMKKAMSCPPILNFKPTPYYQSNYPNITKNIGVAEANGEYGRWFEFGLCSLDMDWGQAVHHYEVARSLKYYGAGYNHGTMVFNGYANHVGNRELGFKLLIEFNDFKEKLNPQERLFSETQWTIADICFHEKKIEESWKIAEKAAEKGSPDACKNVGYIRNYVKEFKVKSRDPNWFKAEKLEAQANNNSITIKRYFDLKILQRTAKTDPKSVMSRVLLKSSGNSLRVHYALSFNPPKTTQEKLDLCKHWYEGFVVEKSSAEIGSPQSQLFSDWLKDCVKIAPKNKYARMCYTHYGHSTGRFNDIPEFATESLNLISKTDPELVYIRAVANFNRRDGKKAQFYESMLKDYNFCIEQDPKNWNYKFSKANLLVQEYSTAKTQNVIDAYEDYFECCKKYCPDERNYPTAYYKLANYLFKKDQNPIKANLYYKKGLAAEKYQIYCYVPPEASDKINFVTLMESMRLNSISKFSD